MKVLAAVVLTALSFAVFGAHEAKAADCFGCPAELAGQTFPEPRAFIETQGWWVQGQTGLAAPDVSGSASDFAFASNHVHLGIPFPLGERLVIPASGGYSWPYLAQWHEQNPTGVSRRVRGGGFQGAESGLGAIPYDPASVGIKFTTENVRFAGAIPIPAAAVNAWRAASPGVHEARFTADTTSKQGKRQYQSGAWNAYLNAPGQAVAVTARGWYEGPGYTNVTMKAKATATTLANGSWYAPGKTVGYGLAQGATRAFAYIDADIHHGSKGIVLFENRSGTDGSFTLPVLPPGDHVVLLGGWEKAAAGWNAGVLRLPFHVN